MAKKGSSAPSPDRRIGQAAMLSAQTGQDALAFMQEQAAITNNWAEQDRDRYQTVFQPLQDAYIRDAQNGPDYSSVAGDVRRARADVSTAFDTARQQEGRRLAAMGVNPASGRSVEAGRRNQIAEGLASAGAGNTTRLQSRARADAESEMMRANAINMGSGLAVNPATSMGLSNGAGGAGFGAAMQGYGQQGQLLNTQYQQQMQSWQAEQQQQASLWGGVGGIAGLGLSMLSSEEYKEDKRPARGALEALEAMPVEEWRYKKGIADEGEHIGPYAEDFHAATGKGDGRSIPLQDIIGVTMGAVQELAGEVKQMKKAMRPRSAGVMEAVA